MVGDSTSRTEPVRFRIRFALCSKNEQAMAEFFDPLADSVGMSMQEYDPFTVDTGC